MPKPSIWIICSASTGEGHGGHQRAVGRFSETQEGAGALPSGFCRSAALQVPPQHFLNLRPLPQGQGSLRVTPGYCGGGGVLGREGSSGFSLSKLKNSGFTVEGGGEGERWKQAQVSMNATTSSMGV